MSDNVTLNAGSGGASIATDDVGGVQYQRNKLDVGGDGISAPVVDTVGASLPVVLGRVDSLDTLANPVAANTAVTKAVGGYTVAMFYVINGSGTEVPEVSYDNGSTWVQPVKFFLRASTGSFGESLGASGAQAPHIWFVQIYGATHVRLRWGSTIAQAIPVRTVLLADNPGLIFGSVTIQSTLTDTVTSSINNWIAVGGTKVSGESALGSQDSTWGGACTLDATRKMLVQPYCVPQLRERAVLDSINDTVSRLALAAVASYRHWVTTIGLVNEGTTATSVEVLDGTTVVWLGYVAAGSANHISLPVPIGGTVNTALNVRCRAASTIHVSVAGYRSQI